MKKSAKIYYFTLTDKMPREDKLSWFANTKFGDIPFDKIEPDKNHNWLNITDNDFDDLLPLANKETKLAKSQKEERAVFKLFSLGVATNRDEWVYDFSEQNLIEKVNFFCYFYQQEQSRWVKLDKNLPINDFVDRSIKWTSELEAHLQKASILKFNSNFIKKSLYRPFINKMFYFDRIIVHRIYQQVEFFNRLF